jgi:hypothetical protein
MSGGISRDTTTAEGEVHAPVNRGFTFTIFATILAKKMSAVMWAGGKGDTEKGKQPAAQKKRTRTTSQAPTTQPALLTADAFAAALGSIPAEDWSRTWAAGRTTSRTIMLRRTSKRVKEVVDKMRLPVVVRLSRSFWYDTRSGTAAEKLQFVLRQLMFMTAGAASAHSSCRAVE